MFVSFRKCSRPQKPDPISDHSCQNLYPFSDQNGSKTIPFEAAHTYIPSIGEYPPPPVYNLPRFRPIGCSSCRSFTVFATCILCGRDCRRGKITGSEGRILRAIHRLRLRPVLQYQQVSKLLKLVQKKLSLIIIFYPRS